MCVALYMCKLCLLTNHFQQIGSMGCSDMVPQNTMGLSIHNKNDTITIQQFCKCYINSQ